MSENSSSPRHSATHLFRGVAISIGLVLWVVVAFFLAGLGVYGLFYALDVLGISPALTAASSQLLQAAMVYVLTLGIAIALPKFILKQRTSLKDIGLQRMPYWKDIGLAFIAVVPYLAISTGLVLLATNYLPGFNADQVQDVGFSKTMNQSGLLVAFITLVILAPVAEEALFRGYLYGKMRKSTSAVVAILLTSLGFAVVHGQINVGIDVFALSIILCLLRELTGSIWAGILLHMIKNAVAFYFLFIFAG